ncbi:MAG TPA: cupin domain-containing protein [Clostridia bacterium]|nr:cupin domain-containing protein [Clostridia bacterium]
MKIGDKIRALRVKYGLTQAELAGRCKLSKGFISQLERDKTSPSIVTLMDLLKTLGTNIRDFFADEKLDEKIVFGKNDYSTVDNGSYSITRLIPSDVKSGLEPVLIELRPGCEASRDTLPNVEVFGYVLSGAITVELGQQREKCEKGESFSFKPHLPHRIINKGSRKAKVLWITPSS